MVGEGKIRTEDDFVQPDLHGKFPDFLIWQITGNVCRIEPNVRMAEDKVQPVPGPKTAQMG